MLSLRLRKLGYHEHILINSWKKRELYKSNPWIWCILNVRRTIWIWKRKCSAQYINLADNW